MIYPKCPFFGCRCMKEECTAFELKDFYKKGELVSFTDCFGFTDVGETYIIKKDVPYCNALKIWLPRGKDV